MEKTSPLDKLTILGLGRKMDKIKELANGIIDNSIPIQEVDAELAYSGVLDDMDEQLVNYDDAYSDGYKAAMEEILNIVDPHRHKLKDEKKVLNLLDFKEHLNKLKENK